MDTIEITAKTVEEAVEIALLELDAERGEGAVEVVSRGRTGLFGLRSERAQVRVTRLAESELPASQAIEIVGKLLSHMMVAALPTIRSAADEESWPSVDIQGEDSGLLIGRRGETLNALQFIVNLILSHQNQSRTRVLLDVEHYKDRRAISLQSLAMRVAERVVTSGRSITLEPMDPAERRVVHISLADHPRVMTESAGEGQGRRVTVMLREQEASQDT